MKKVIITGTYTQDEVWSPPRDYEVWGVASCLFDDDMAIHLDKVFEIHRRDEYNQDTIIEISKTKIPVVMLKKDKRVTNVELYPMDKIINKYGEYFTNSISLMLVYAVEQGYNNIKIVNIEMQSFREAIIERANLEYYIGLFRGQGIKIDTSETTLCSSNMMYGRDNILRAIDHKMDQINRMKSKLRICHKQLAEWRHKKVNYFKRSSLLRRQRDYYKIIGQMQKLETAIEIYQLELRYI